MRRRRNTEYRASASTFTLLLLLAFSSGAAPAGASDVSRICAIDSVSGRPVAGVSIELSNERTLVEAETEGDGCARWQEMKPGRYHLKLQRAGYLVRRDLQGALEAVSLPTELLIRLTPTAAIAGSVSDAEGRPLEGAKVATLIRRGAPAQARYALSGDAVPTDDRGLFRIDGLTPGRYSVALLSLSDANAVFTPTAYGAGSKDMSNAEFFDVGPGETRWGVNLTVPPFTSVSTLSGTISSIPEDKGQVRAALSLYRRGEPPVPVVTALAQPDGTFTLSGVPSGEYRLIAWAPAGGLGSDDGIFSDNLVVASLPVSLSGTSRTVDLKLEPPVRVSLTRALTGGAEKGCAASREIVFRSLDGWPDIQDSRSDSDGESHALRLPAGEYRIETPDAGPQCGLASVVIGGQTASRHSLPIISRTAIKLVFTAETGRVSGRVVDPDGIPRKGTVVLFSNDDDGIQYATAMDEEGRFSFDRVLVGSYQLATVSADGSTNYLDPAAAAEIGAQAVRVGRDQTVVVNVSNSARR